MPTDGSEVAERAVDYGTVLATAFDATVLAAAFDTTVHAAAFDATVHALSVVDECGSERQA